MASRNGNAALKALLVATLVSSFLFQGALGQSCCYCRLCYKNCLQPGPHHPPGNPKSCHQYCYHDICENAPKLDDLASHNMGVDVAAGGGNLGKGNGTEAGVAP
ncbi:hypothetical protein EJB05_04611 [Eragrostis curvula]|uniref:Uncharacterized protein n=1 Tax=Eragrostis curvula TaxID=38414 RepID=A0A5J9WAV8_9POAL|nr:hypothetical protein EJB05_04611 [Eragrostis curvula]